MLHHKIFYVMKPLGLKVPVMIIPKWLLIRSIWNRWVTSKPFRPISIIRFQFNILEVKCIQAKYILILCFIDFGGHKGGCLKFFVCFSVWQLFFHTKSPCNRLEIFINSKTIYPVTFLMHSYPTLSLRHIIYI